MQYFQNQKTVDEIKARYHELVKENHPDLGGDGEAMKEINAELEMALQNAMVGHFQDWQNENPDRTAAGFDADVFADILRDIIDWNITIEVIGYWIYAFQSFDYKDQLKEKGFWFSKKHKAWVYSGDRKRKRRTKLSTDDIRGLHGSKVVRQRERVHALPA